MIQIWLELIRRERRDSPQNGPLGGDNNLGNPPYAQNPGKRRGFPRFSTPPPPVHFWTPVHFWPNLNTQLLFDLRILKKWNHWSLKTNLEMKNVVRKINRKFLPKISKFSKNHSLLLISLHQLDFRFSKIAKKKSACGGRKKTIKVQLLGEFSWQNSLCNY